MTLGAGPQGRCFRFLGALDQVEKIGQLPHSIARIVRDT